MCSFLLICLLCLAAWSFCISITNIIVIITIFIVIDIIIDDMDGLQIFSLWKPENEQNRIIPFKNEQRKW